MLKLNAKNCISSAAVLAIATLACASPSHAKSGSSELVTHTPTQIIKVRANASRTAYEQTGLMQLSANVKLDLFAGIAAHIKNWKTWLRLDTEDDAATDFKDDGVSESYPVFQRPQKFEGVVPVGIPHMSLSPFAVGLCNKLADTLRSQGHSNNDIFSTDRTIPLQLSAEHKFDTIGATAKEIEQADSFDSNMTLVCKGRPHEPVQTASDFKFEHGDLKVNDVDLFLSTFSGANTQPNPATTCKKGRVLVRLKTNKVGPTKFKLWTKIGGDTSSKVVDAWAAHDGSGGYKAEHTEWVEVNGPTQIQAMAEEMVTTNGFNKSTQWKDLMLQCSGTGGDGHSGGGFVQDSIPPDNVLPDATYSGEITVADSALTPKNQCPREGQAVFKINSNKSSAVDYKVDCTGGRSWTGTMQMFANGPGKFQGTAAKTFDVDKTENVACVLKRAEGNQNFVLALNAKQFTCANPTMPPSTTDLTPNPGRPEEPPVNVQTLTGDFGIADYGAPKCPRTAKALVTFKSPKADNIHYSLDCKYQNKSGVVTPQPSPSGGYMAATLVTLDVTQTLNDSCTLRTVAPYNPKDHVTKEHQFVCATPSGHGATSDLTPETRDEPVLPAAPVSVGGLVVKTPAFCDGGSLKAGQCICRTGWTKQPAHKLDHGIRVNGFKCIPGASDTKTTSAGDADKSRIDALKIAKEKAEAERLRRAKIAAQKVEAERLRKAKIAAQKAAQRKLQLQAANKARLLKLQQQRARKAAAARARANALQALTAKRTRNVKIAPKRRANPAPALNRMMMLRAR